MKKLLLILLIIASQTSLAEPAWYGGKLTRVWKANANYFIITVSSSALDDCKHKYAYFMRNELTQEHFDALYSMALTAFISDQTVRMVIDKDLNGDLCHVKSMDMRK